MKPAILFIAAGCALFAQAPAPPAQPIPFSHKQHSALGVKCGDCHATPDPGEVVTFPAASKCMICHRTIKTDSASIKDLKRYADTKQEIPWVRVYEIPSWVYFSHKAHTDGGATCDNCHGPVAQREQLFKETDLSMGGCMTCHRVHQAPLDCVTCHEAKS